MESEISREAYLSWVEAHRPDVVLSPNLEHYDWLREAGYAVPADISFAALGPAREDLVDIARVEVGYRKIGSTAIDILKTRLANERLGPTDNPAVTLLRGDWIEGASVLSPAAAAEVCA
jgi:LacI family transcriptional regulator